MERLTLDSIIEYEINELNEIEQCYQETCNYDFNTMFTEASKNKLPIHKRIWNVIKRILKAIADGIRCNRNEVSITNEYKKEGTEDVLACVVSAMPHCALIFPQCIDSNWRMDQNDVMELKDKLHDIYWDHPDLHDIRNDIHVGNIGKINGNVVCIDYGDIKIVKK